MSTNTVKFKVFGEGYEKLNSTHPSGISYTLGFCLPIYDSSFDLNNGGTVDVADAEFKSEDGLTNLDWFAQYENVNGGVLEGFLGEKLFLAGSFDSEGKYTHASQYTLDGNLLNVAGGLLPQKDLATMVTSDFWKVNPYYPLNAQATSGSVSAGTYEATIPGDAGDFTFNKLAIFIKELDANGDETGVYYFFGMVYANIKLIKRFNNDPEAYNPSFKIKLNVVVSDLTTTDPYDDYVFINDGYWNLISSDTISTLYHTVGKNGNPLYSTVYRNSSFTHFKYNSDIFGTSQESITEPSVNGNRLLSMSRRPKWSLYDAGVVTDEREMRNILYNFNVYTPTGDSTVEDVITSIVYGSETQTVQTRRSFVFETRDDEVAQLPNQIVSRYHFDNSTDGGGNVVFGRGLYASIKNSFLMERGGFDENNYESIFYADSSRSFGSRNRMGFWVGANNANITSYGDIFGEDNLIVGNFGHIIGQCNLMNNSYSSIIGNKNELGINNQIPQSISNMKNRGEFFHRIDNVNVRIYGDSNFVNSTYSWNSGLDLGINGSTLRTTPWGGADWVGFRSAIITDSNIYGSMNNVLGTLRGMTIATSNSFIRANLNIGGVGTLMTDSNSAFGSNLFGIDSTFGSMTNSNFGANGNSKVNGNTMLGLAHSESNVGGYHSMAIAGSSALTSVFSMVNVGANEVTGGYPDVWSSRQGYTYANDYTVSSTRTHSWNQSIYNNTGDAGASGDYGQYFNDIDGALVGHYTVLFDWYSVVGKQVITGSPNGTYSRDVCDIYHVGTDEQLLDANDDFEAINGYANHVYMPRGGVFATQLENDYANGNNWYAYIPIKHDRTMLVKIESIEIVDNNGTDYIKIVYVNPINLSSTRQTSSSEIQEGVYHINYNSSSSTKFSNNLFALVEVEDAKLQSFLATKDLEHQLVVVGISALDNAVEDSFISDKKPYFYGSVVNLAPATRVMTLNDSLAIGSSIYTPGRITGSSMVSNGAIFMNANHKGLDLLGQNVRYEFKLGNNTHAQHHFGYDGSDLSAESEFRQYHTFIPNDGYDSYYDFIRGKDININMSENGFSAFNFYYGSKLDIGKDLVNDMVGSTGQMYNFVFGHNIQVTSDSGLYTGNQVGTKYANNNLTAMGVNLMVSRSDQFVFGRNNTGDPRNLFEFGIGQHYENPIESSRQNGFAFGYIYDGYEDPTDNNLGRALFPSFKIETGYLFMGSENLGLSCKEFNAFVPDGASAIGIGDFVYAFANPENVDNVEIIGGETVVNHTASADLTKMMVAKFSDTDLDWETSGWQGSIIGVAMSAQTVDGGKVLIGTLGGPFEVLRNHSEWPTSVPEKVNIVATKQDYPYVGGRTFQVYLN